MRDRNVPVESDEGKARADLWMPLYIKDYYGDTVHLTTEQHGAYLLMIMAAWTAEGRLPADDGQLAAICRLTRSGWNKHRSVLLQFFAQEAGELRHKRISEELDRARHNIETARANGRKGGRPRKQTETETKPTGFDPVPKTPHFKNPTESSAGVEVDRLVLTLPIQEVSSDYQVGSTADVISLGRGNGR